MREVARAEAGRREGGRGGAADRSARRAVGRGLGAGTLGKQEVTAKVGTGY